MKPIFKPVIFSGLLLLLTHACSPEALLSSVPPEITQAETSQSETQITSNGVLSESETKGLLLMREEEKLAYDVYQVLYQQWRAMPFENISQSEQSHMNAVGDLLTEFKLEDPMQANPGQFANADLQALYETLTQKGKTSLVDAFQVGAEIEELDIADLEKLLAQTDNARIKEVYQELLRGSRNHLRSFMRNLAQNGASYVPVHISQEDFDRIVNSAMERQNNP